MVTESQRKAFLDALNTICNTSILISKKHAKYDRWLKNFYYRYNNNTMPEEHIQMFKSRLNNYHITAPPSSRHILPISIYALNFIIP